MGRSVPEATIAIGRIRAMPFGRSRAEAAARQVRLIETEGPDEVRAYALESLVEALTWTGDSDKAVVPFVKLLRWWDTHPELFDQGDQNILFWEFGWVMNDLCRNPKIPVEQVMSTFEDMERRFALANRGMERVWACRLEWELMRGGTDAEQVFTTWLTLPVDDEDSCLACHQEHQADYLLYTGDMTGAVALLESTIASEVSCSREPASMLAMLAWCYLELGDLESVERVLPHAIAEIKAATSMSVLVAYARLFEIFGRGGNVPRAVGLIPVIMEGFQVATPYVQLETLRHVISGTGALDKQGYGSEETGSVPAGTTIADFLAQSETQAQELTKVFDRRHGNTLQATRLDKARSASVSARPLVLSAPAEPTPVHAPTVHAPVPVPVPETLAQAEEAFEVGDHKLAEALYRMAAEEAQNQGKLAQAGWCWAEAARNAQEIGKLTVAGNDYTEAHSRLKAAEVTLEEIAPMFVAWAPGVTEQNYSSFLEMALEDYPSPVKPQCPTEIENILPLIFDASMVSSPLIKRYVLARAELRDAVARVMATWGGIEDQQSAVAMAQESASRFSTLGRTDQAAHAWWLAGRLGAQLGDPATEANFTMALQGFMSTGERNRRFGSQVAGEYASYLRVTGQKPKAESVLAAWVDKDR